MKLTIIKFCGVEIKFNLLLLNQIITRNTSKELQSSLYANSSKGSLQSNLYGNEFNLVYMQMHQKEFMVQYTWKGMTISSICKCKK